METRAWNEMQTMALRLSKYIENFIELVSSCFFEASISLKTSKHATFSFILNYSLSIKYRRIYFNTKLSKHLIITI